MNTSVLLVFNYIVIIVLLIALIIFSRYVYKMTLNYSERVSELTSFRKYQEKIIQNIVDQLSDKIDILERTIKDNSKEVRESVKAVSSMKETLNNLYTFCSGKPKRGGE